MSRTLRAAVVGSGHLGRHHARVLGSIDGVELVGVVDPAEERGRAAAETAGARWFADVSDLPRELDLVSIAAPTPLHFDLARGFLERGVHCLVEKPMTATAADARALADIASRAGRILQVGHIERFNPVLDAWAGLGVRPRAIHAERLAPHTGRSVDTSVVFDLMIHDLDLVSSLVGDEIAGVEASAGALVGPLEDWAECRLRFRGGCVATLVASRVSPAAARRTRVHGHGHTVVIDFAARTLDVVERGADAPQTVRTIRGGDAEPLRRELEHLVECVRTGAAPRVGAAAGLAAVELAEQVLRLARS